jgi:hypothetical protein
VLPGQGYGTPQRAVTEEFRAKAKVKFSGAKRKKFTEKLAPMKIHSPKMSHCHPGLNLKFKNKFLTVTAMVYFKADPTLSTTQDVLNNIQHLQA